MADIETVGILGSGIMAAGLAEVAARAGHDVVVRSRTQAAASALYGSIKSGLTRQVAKGKLTDDERTAILDRITPTDHLGRLAECDLVIESVVEDLDVKKALFAELEQIVKPSGILATNTSTLPVIELAMMTQRPDKVCGIHFFNPALMKLVEVVRPITASDDTITIAMSFAERCGKDAIEVADRAGFVVNALLFPYLNNAVRMLEHGTATKEAIDIAMQAGCNFPMGLFACCSTSSASTRRWRSSTRSTRSSATPTTRLRDVAAARRGRPPRSQERRRLLRVLSLIRTSCNDEAVKSAGPIEPPASRWSMPDAAPVDDTGLVAVGADLEPGTLLAAYRAGLFPMPLDGRRIAWFSPDPRGIVPLDGLRISRSLRRSVRDFDVLFDTRFREVMQRCADPERDGDGSRPSSSTPIQSCTGSGGRTRSRPTAVVSSSVGSMACASTGCSRVSRCSTSCRMPRRSPWCTSCAGS